MFQSIKALKLEAFAHPILILGPAYSGKSTIAHQFLDHAQPAAVIGTSSLKEHRFLSRIQELKSLRPKNWDHFEQIGNLPELIREQSNYYPQILIDSLNQWIATSIVEGGALYSTEQLADHLLHEVMGVYEQVVTNCQKVKFVLISSEVGAGISPQDNLPRMFRQLTGIMNQKLAMAAHSVITVTAGIPSVLKPNSLLP